MNTKTGELRRFMKDETIPDDFVELVTEQEKLMAAKELEFKESVMLEESNQLRKQVTQRYNGMNRQQRRKAERELRKRRNRR